MDQSRRFKLQIRMKSSSYFVVGAEALLVESCAWSFVGLRLSGKVSDRNGLSSGKTGGLSHAAERKR
jgi:hypothetical protein